MQSLRLFIEQALARTEESPSSETTDAVPSPPDNRRWIRRVDPIELVDSKETIDDARLKIRGEIMRYLTTKEPDHILLIRAAAGVGKTWIGVEMADWVARKMHKRVFYAGARHDFFTDVNDAISGQNLRNSLWYEWLPRQDTGDVNAPEHTCIYKEQSDEWLKRGYDGHNFCKQACGYQYIKNTCKYHLQTKRREPIVFGQHQHITLGHPLMKKFYCVIGDENPLGAFIYTERVPRSHIYRREMPFDEPLTEILLELQKLCNELHDIDSSEHISGTRLLEAIGGAKSVYDACDVYAIPANLYIPKTNVTDRKEVESLPYHYLPDFVPMIQKEAEWALQGKAYIERISATKHGLVIQNRHAPVNTLPAHVVWFDATGDAAIYEKMFGRKVVVVDARPKFEGKIVQITDRANGKTSLSGESGSIKFDKIIRVIKMIGAKHKNPAVITFKANRAQIEKHGLKALHFYANRGTNQLENNDAVIVVGTPQPPITEIVSMAKSLWLDRMEPFDTSWVEVDRTYKHVSHGESIQYTVSEYADPILNLMLYQNREAEIVQSANRARIVTKANTVYLMTNIPIDDLPPDEVTNIAAMSGAPDDVNAYNWIAVLQEADRIEAEKGFVVPSDLVEALGVSMRSAEKYIEHLVDNGGWQHAIVKKKTLLIRRK